MTQVHPSENKRIPKITCQPFRVPTACCIIITYPLSSPIASPPVQKQKKSQKSNVSQSSPDRMFHIIITYQLLNPSWIHSVENQGKNETCQPISFPDRMFCYKQSSLTSYPNPSTTHPMRNRETNTENVSLLDPWWNGTSPGNSCSGDLPPSCRTIYRCHWRHPERMSRKMSLPYRSLTAWFPIHHLPTIHPNQHSPSHEIPKTTQNHVIPIVAWPYVS